MEAGRDVGAVIQAVAILRVLANAQAPQGVTAIARAAGLNPSTTLNILRTLVKEGLVAQDAATKTYGLDFGLLELARTLLNKTKVDVLQPHLQRLTTQFDATASVWRILPDHKATLVGRVLPENGVHIQFRIATRLPAFAGAVGRIVAAGSNPSEAALQAAFVRIRWNKPMPFETYMEEVARAREDGYAIDVGALIRSVTSVAAGIRDTEDLPRLVVAAHTFQGQLSPDGLTELGVELRRLCHEAQRALYGRSAPREPGNVSSR